VSAPAIDGFLLLSFGGPQGPEDVLPFLRQVTRGRGVPDDRLNEVAQHYLHFGGISPITAQNEALLAAIKAEFEHRGIKLPVYFGNRNWRPYATDTVRDMSVDGVAHAVVLATSATGSYSACRQYLEDLDRASAVLEGAAPQFTKLRHYFDHPGFIRANADAMRVAITKLEPAARENARLIFTAHSIPVAMNDTSGPSGGLYLAQHQTTARLVAEEIYGPETPFDLVWQSRSGSVKVPWFEPDINDHLIFLASLGVRAVVLAPTGFVSDHLEVIWDLDQEAAATAARLGIAFVRAATAGTHPAFVAGIVDLVEEQLSGRPAESMSRLGLCGIDCPATCCPAPRRR
jgi:ferrochelatase